MPTVYNIKLLVHSICDGKRSHICHSRVCSLVGRPTDKRFHLNVNQKSNKSIIVIWKRTALFAFSVISLTFIPSQGGVTTSHSDQEIPVSKIFSSDKLQLDAGGQCSENHFIWNSYFNKHLYGWQQACYKSAVAQQFCSFKMSIYVESISLPCCTSQ